MNSRYSNETKKIDEWMHAHSGILTLDVQGESRPSAGPAQGRQQRFGRGYIESHEIPSNHMIFNI